MPALVTHWLFAQDALARPGAPAWAQANPAMVSLGSQGPDPFFFRGQVPWRRRTVRGDFGGHIHEGPPEHWFQPLLEGPEQAAWQALCYGFLLHYQLDRHLHPLVFSASGFDAQGQLSPPWNNRHARLEFALDMALVVQRREPTRLRQAWRLLQAPADQVAACSQRLARAFPADLGPRDYLEAWQDMGTIIHLLHDPAGAKAWLLDHLGLADSQPRGLVHPALPDAATARDWLAAGQPAWPDPVNGQPRHETVLELYAQALAGLDQLHRLLALPPGRQGPAGRDAWSAWFANLNHEGHQPGQRLTHHRA